MNYCSALNISREAEGGKELDQEHGYDYSAFQALTNLPRISSFPFLYKFYPALPYGGSVIVGHVRGGSGFALFLLSPTPQ